MLSYAKIQNKPRVFQCLTGLNPQAFQQLLAAFLGAYEQALDQQEAQRESPRQRRRGGGRKSALATMEDKLVFILVYFRLYPIQEVQGLLFGLGQPQANEWIHRLAPILNAALGYEKQLPARRAADLEQILTRCPGLEFIIDGVRSPVGKHNGALSSIRPDDLLAEVLRGLQARTGLNPALLGEIALGAAIVQSKTRRVSTARGDGPSAHGYSLASPSSSSNSQSTVLLWPSSPSSAATNLTSICGIIEA